MFNNFSLNEKVGEPEKKLKLKEKHKYMILDTWILMTSYSNSVDKTTQI